MEKPDIGRIWTGVACGFNVGASRGRAISAALPGFLRQSLSGGRRFASYERPRAPTGDERRLGWLDSFRLCI
jgi:hypothetical protein